jgi:mannose-6-phosphate isomerase-like protein (cupin superfamily)
VGARDAGDQEERHGTGEAVNQMPHAIIRHSGEGSADPGRRFSAEGSSFSIHEWRGSGPPLLHVHHADDEAWHVLEGTLRFRFSDGTVDVGAGGTVFVPASVAHTYEAIDARYLIVLTPRLASLIHQLQQTRDDPSRQRAIYAAHDSELLETPPA